MTHRHLVVALLVAALGLAGCGKDEPTDAGTPPAGTPDASDPKLDFPADEAGVKALATALRFDRAMLDALRPTAEQCAAIGATAEDGTKLAAYVDGLFADLPPNGIGGNDAQTDVVVRTGTVADLKAGTNPSLPGGYTDAAAHLRDGLTIWGFAYVEPGKDSGMAFDGLVQVDGRWVFAPKLWRAFR